MVAILFGVLVGAGGQLSGPWAMPATIASAAVAFLAIIIMGSGWYAAANARASMKRDMIRMEETYAQMANEVAHLKQLNEIAEDRRQQAVRALALAEEDLSEERRRRREADARLTDSSLPDLPPPPEELAANGQAIPEFQWHQATPQQPAPRPVPLNRRQLEQQTRNLNADTVLRQLQPDLARDARGNVVGITSQNFSSLPIARQLGLQNGDVISNINGVNISGLGSYVAIEQAVQRGGPISVTILRNGQPLTATFNLR